MLTLLNGAAIALTALLLPGITVAHQRLLNYLILGAMFGLLNAFVKPIVQFLTISLLFIGSSIAISIAESTGSTIALLPTVAFAGDVGSMVVAALFVVVLLWRLWLGDELE